MAKKKGRKAAGNRLSKDPLAELISDINRFDNSDSVRFFDNVKKFFAFYIKSKHELTYEEIIAKAEKKKLGKDFKGKLQGFVKKLSLYEYSGRPISKEELANLNNEFKGILLAISVSPVEEKILPKISTYKSALHGISFLYLLLRDLFMLFYKIPRLLFLKAFSIYSGKTRIAFPFTLLEKERLEEIKNKIGETQHYFETKRFYFAKKKYQEIFAEFNRLGLRQKQKIYLSVKELREKLISVDTTGKKTAELIKQISATINKKDPAEVKTKYVLLLRQYSELSVVKQQELYPQIRTLYLKMRQHKPIREINKKLEGLLDETRLLIGKGVKNNKVTIKQKYLALFNLYNKLPIAQKKEAYHKIKNIKAKLLASGY